VLPHFRGETGKCMRIARFTRILDRSESNFELASAIRSVTTFCVYIASGLMASPSCFRCLFFVTEFGHLHDESSSETSPACGVFPKFTPSPRRRT
jgi:hypothetical protein